MRKASEIANDMHITVSSRTPFGSLEIWQPDFAAAVTAARLEVVARLREIADRVAGLRVDDAGKHVAVKLATQQAIAGVMRGCCDQLEHEILEASKP